MADFGRIPSILSKKRSHMILGHPLNDYGTLPFFEEPHS